MAKRPAEAIRITILKTRRRLSASSYGRKQAMKRISRQLGLEYSGTIHRRRAPQKPVRGLTTSATHKDLHYTSGAINDYAVAFVERHDIIKSPASRKAQSQRWLVLEIQLHTDELPHVVIRPVHTPRATYARLMVKNPYLHPIKLGALGVYSVEFTSRYTVCTSQSHAVETERLFTPKIARTLAAHFWPLAIELDQGHLYIYAEEEPANYKTINRMIKNGLWLATQLEKTSTKR